MKRTLKAMLIASALAAGSLVVASPASAHDYRRSGVSVYLDTGNVAIGYRNGYYDNHRRWHNWRHRDEWRHYRRHHRARYHDYYYRQDRGHHYGWRNQRYRRDW